MEAFRIYRSLNRSQRNTFLACFLGWTLDALDFFLLTFVVRDVAAEFSVSIVKVTFAITLTLMMRPLGALTFGMLGDRFGRRIPLMIDIVFYSVMELLTAFSPNYTVFLLFRALYGIGMGGEWGLGASLAMECLPTNARGLASGILQQGYSFGFLLAAVIYWLVFPHFGWRALFVVGALPALLVIYIRARVPESEAWQRQRDTGDSLGIGRMIAKNWRLLVYVVLLMTAFNYMSHGTQDLYPTFLQKQRQLSVNQTAPVAIIYNLGAICGGTILGAYSQRWGRRRTIIIAAGLGILLIPAWVFSSTLPLLIAGGFLMQFMVQGAWGVVPVHLNELSPPAWRGTFPGVAYQLGNFFSANAAMLQAKLAEHFVRPNGQPDYALTMACVMGCVFFALIFLAAIGREARGIEF
ncbi:MAG TPA: MFS transporter [Chthoniobacterales bacterium]|jgi:SHS family lactate transporter-like MFS transporter